MTDLISRQALLEEYDRLHVGKPGRARKMIEDAPSVQVEYFKPCKNCIHLGHAYMAPCKNCRRNQMMPDWYTEETE